jgi:hypothetical protein
MRNIYILKKRLIIMTLERFMKTYANLPINVREEVILVVNIDGKDKPITWDVAYLEIKSKTKLGEKILKTLKELDII